MDGTEVALNVVSLPELYFRDATRRTTVREVTQATRLATKTPGIAHVTTSVRAD
jgi:hypothetical protein